MEVTIVLKNHDKPVDEAFTKRGFNITNRELKVMPEILTERTFEFVVTDQPVDCLPRSTASGAPAVAGDLVS